MAKKSKSKPAAKPARKPRVRDRIKELRRVPVERLRANPKNFREHPDRQRSAMQSVLRKIGFADALLAREDADGTLHLIDGHLRADVADGMEVPVLVLDVTAQEADLILATHDAIGEMAEENREMFDDLVAGMNLSDRSLTKLLGAIREDMAHAETIAEADETIDAESLAGVDLAGESPKLRERKEISLVASFHVLVDCKNERDQERLYNQMKKQGRECRVLTL